MDNNRAETARDHDDSEIIDNASDAGGTVLRSGGGLGRDIGTQDELDRVDDPDSTTRATKQDDINNNVARPSDRARGG